MLQKNTIRYKNFVSIDYI